MFYTSNTTSHNLTTKQITQKSQKHNYTVPNGTNITHNKKVINRKQITSINTSIYNTIDIIFHKSENPN